MIPCGFPTLSSAVVFRQKAVQGSRESSDMQNMLRMMSLMHYKPINIFWNIKKLKGFKNVFEEVVKHTCFLFSSPLG